MEDAERSEMVRGEAAFAADALVFLAKALRDGGRIDAAAYEHIDQLILQHLTPSKGHFVEARAHALQRRLGTRD
jgi:hypothetical protein